MSKFSAQIQNYQILENARLDFEEGLNVIVGPSSNGKTSILRAIEAAIYNKVGNSFITQGANATAVGLKNDQHTVVWKKSQDAGMYKVDGQVYNKIGRGQLDEVSEALQMSEIDVNGDKVRVNFLRQMEYPFLLDKNGSQLFEFLAMSNDNDKLSEVHQEIRSDIRKTSSKIDTLVGNIDSYKNIVKSEQTQLENYKSVEETVNKVLSLDTEVQSYRKLEELIEDLQEKQKVLVEARTQILKRREFKTQLETALSGIDITMVSSLKESIEDIDRSRENLLAMRDKYRRRKDVAEQLREQFSKVDIEDIKETKEQVEALSRDLNSIATKDTELDRLRQNQIEIRAELHLVRVEMKKFTVCPLCGSPLTEEHNHEEIGESNE